VKYWYEIVMAIVILVILASLAFHARKGRKNVPSPPESFYMPYDRTMPP